MRTKLYSLIAVLLFVFAIFAMPAAACRGEACEDNVNASASGAFSAYDSDSLFRDNGSRGVSAFADGYGEGNFSANSSGDKIAGAFGTGSGNVDPSVGAVGGANFVAVGAMSKADSNARAMAFNDGGHRDAYAATYGSVYQQNSAYINGTPGNWASGGNMSGANYYDSDYEGYTGRNEIVDYRRTRDWYHKTRYGGHWHYRYDPVWANVCRPGSVDASSDGGAFTAGGTALFTKQTDGRSITLGGTGSVSMGNNGVYGSGSLATATFAEKGGSVASTYTDGNYNYNGNYFGAGATIGGGVSVVDAGSASATAGHISVATGSNDRQVD